ncbi:ABC transporter permease subunit/CPBP intramembrane protease [Stratiformator vulcanicus]|uniref:ABC-2 family transporter protein n=1 Tax=Stratiformator vulcanicus TaxID=2527980 RepID=A0A517R1S5_9PLAN|nr:ABC transporter permease subunit/CPBP intramembrane protease [Stratiformator vulcanicus]QDT37793.1 ABC-2 family transporter protein [Stratiformator vulcanicus]
MDGPERDSGQSGSVGRFGRLLLKELRETLRDRRTTITLVAMPLIVYPLLGVVLQRFVLSQAEIDKGVEYTIVLSTEEEAFLFGKLLTDGERLIKLDQGNDTVSDPSPQTARSTSVPSSTSILNQRPDGGVKFSPVVPTGELTGTDIREIVERGSADLGVRITKNEQRRLFQADMQPVAWPLDVEFIVRRGSVSSEDARRLVRDRLRAINRSYLTTALKGLAKETPYGMPAEISFEEVGKKPEESFSLAGIVPLVLVLMTITGAVYPAIDLTAGERERGTLEGLIATPLPRSSILASKYIAVLTVALLTAIVNVLGMFVTAYATGLDAFLFGPGGVSGIMIIQILGLLVLFAAFFSAVMLCLTSFARSFKEAQAYLIPLMLVSLTPGIMALLPGLELTLLVALTPLANIVVLARDILEGDFNLFGAGIALISTAVYTVAALAAATRIFGTDAILYGGEGTWQDVFGRPDEERAVPSVNEAITYLVGLFPAFLILSAVPSRLGEFGIATRLVVGAAITSLAFGIAPILFAVGRRIRVRSAFQLGAASPTAFIAAVMLGSALWVFAYEVGLFTISSSQIEQMQEFFEPWKAELKSIPLALKLICLAVVPAVCEELFFRGFLFSAFKPRVGGWWTVLLTAFLFALFHVFVTDGLMLGRFPPTFLLGLALSFIALRSGSVLPGIAMHGINNGLLLSVAHHEDTVASWGLAIENQRHLPSIWLSGAAVVVLLGLCTLAFTKPRHE